MTKPFEECPRFLHCSANVCPLDPDQDLRDFVEGEEKCGVGKTYRIRIAEKYPQALPKKGMKPREWAAHKAWASLPAEEQERRRAAASASGKRLQEALQARKGGFALVLEK